ncbi:MAG: PIG-L family deacetylase [Gemmatimonadaceae bacterium]
MSGRLVPERVNRSKYFVRIVRAVAMLLCLGVSSRVLMGQGAGATTLGPLVEGLGVNMRVLVIGAHPDDEDTQLIAWLARGRQVETAYLALTRGDGGQNLIGNELGEALGAIRTEELLAARRLDGGKQFFARAYDFGFSKNAEEALTQWPKDSLLRDVLTVVRTFRPHVIVSVFSGTPRDGHGQHQVAGLLAREAYDVAGDTVRFPRAMTGGMGGWTPLKFYRGAFFRNDAATIRINVGEFSPVLGRSYSEIAADSRSQHRSQAMGSLQRKGVRYDFLIREAVRVSAPEDPKAEQSIFDGIDTTWTRFRSVVTAPSRRASLDSLGDAFAAVRAQLDLVDPSRVVPALAHLQVLLQRVCGPAAAGNPCATLAPDGSMRVRDGDLHGSMEVVSDRLERALALATGVAVEATAAREVYATSDSIGVQVETFNRGKLPVSMNRLMVVASNGAITRDIAGRTLRPDSSVRDSLSFVMSSVTSPWWLRVPRRGAVFGVPGSSRDEASASASATLLTTFTVGEATFGTWTPIVNRVADPVRGDVSRPVAAAPAVTVTLDRQVEYAPANSGIQRPVRVHLRSAASATNDVRVSLELPSGLLADSAVRSVSLPAGAQRTLTFNVRGRLAPGRHQLRATATAGGQTFGTGYTAIEYDHIRTQRLYRPATLALEAVDVTVPRGLTVAYINGVGDNIAPMLEQLGVNVTVLDPAMLPRTDLSTFGAVIVGTRAYEASEALVANNARLLDYARDGGTLVVQYGQYEMQSAGIMPYPITLTRPADRVTVENAPVQVLDAASSLLNAPNKISGSDFAGWQQDLTLYMPRTFDKAYTPLLETHDPGEAANQGALLVAALGKGTYVYTTLAFFRQLPAGVPGAARLFVNLMAAKAPRVAQ